MQDIQNYKIMQNTITITNNPNDISFSWLTGYKRNVAHGQIQSISIKDDGAIKVDGKKLNIVLTGSESAYSQHRILVAYKDVISPVTASIEDLRALIMLWNQGYGQPEDFTAIAGQSVFTTSKQLANTVLVFINGAYYNSANYTYSVGSNSLTLLTPLTGGEQVTIVII